MAISPISLTVFLVATKVLTDLHDPYISNIDKKLTLTYYLTLSPVPPLYKCHLWNRNDVKNGQRKKKKKKKARMRHNDHTGERNKRIHGTYPRPLLFYTNSSSWQH